MRLPPRRRFVKRALSRSETCDAEPPPPARRRQLEDERPAALLKVLSEVEQGYTPGLKAKADLLVCPPATLVFTAAHALLGSGVAVGGQDCHAKEAGAFTGDISAEMLAMPGRPSRSSAIPSAASTTARRMPRSAPRLPAAHRAGLAAIVCVGETQGEREAGRTLAVVRRQLRGSVPEASRPANLVVAYEPVWSIGTGLTPTAADVAEVHALIRDELRRIVGKAEEASVRILYGGSVKPANAKELLAVENVDGALRRRRQPRRGGFLGDSRGRIWRRRGLRGSEETAFARACRRPERVRPLASRSEVSRRDSLSRPRCAGVDRP
jgi:triosephosphate isomerase